jgi:L-2-hydroxyglutarate oxidase LhgO
MLREADVLVIGGGVVGLAITVSLSQQGYFVTLLEKHPRLATENSSRNSGVIHSGLYYPEGSLKAELCVRGRDLLYARCKRHGIAHRRLGKLIVARDEAEAGELELLAKRADANGAGNVEMLDAVGLSIHEENIRGHAALLVEETGVVRTHELIRSLTTEADALRAETFVGMEVIALERVNDAWEAVVRSPGSEGTLRFRGRFVVNAAGLCADHVAQLAGVDVHARGLVQRFCRGTWFSLHERYRKAIGRLVYPVPHRAGAGVNVLGVHLTRDLEGFLHAGPDAEWLPSLDAHSFSLENAHARRSDVLASLVAWFPDLKEDDLTPLMCGVRPKLHGPDEGARDFVIEEASADGAPGFIMLLGIESPGLTASLAIAERVRALIDERA